MTDTTYRRLSDKILDALELSLEQEDTDMADLLSRALDLALTRSAGGKDFQERRDYSERIENALISLDALKKQA